MFQDPTKRAAYFAWIVVCLVWGTTYLSIRVALETIFLPLLSAAFVTQQAVRSSRSSSVCVRRTISRPHERPATGCWRRSTGQDSHCSDSS